MTSSELSEWMAYYNLEPWGEDRADLRVAILSSITANANRGKTQKPFKPADFMPYREQEKKDEVVELKDFLRRRSR